MIKRILFLAAVCAVFIAVSSSAIARLSRQENRLSFNDLSVGYAWAQEAVASLAEKGAVSGIEDNVFSPKSSVTKEQLAKMLVLALGMDAAAPTSQTYLDVPSTRWSFPYIEAAKDFFPKSAEQPINEFFPEQACTREETAAALVNALKLEPDAAAEQALAETYADAADISPVLSAHTATACKNGILQGSDGLLRPKAAVSRAEAAMFLYRATLLRDGKTVPEKSQSGQTPIAGESTVTPAQAKAWARAKGAHERFIAIADAYWKYGKELGIRPEVLYAQAAKETNYGKYTGNVVPEQNNWAGIKTKDADGDKTEDHETFASADDGVRAHFNHMAAYLGKNPAGQTHDRYAVVATASWAGTIQFAEELGGRWAPDPSYGIDLVKNYLVPMASTPEAQ